MSTPSASKRPQVYFFFEDFFFVFLAAGFFAADFDFAFAFFAMLPSV